MGNISSPLYFIHIVQLFKGPMIERSQDTDAGLLFKNIPLANEVDILRAFSYFHIVNFILQLACLFKKKCHDVLL